jgi:hypothetical protein
VVLDRRTYDRGWYRPEALRAMVNDHVPASGTTAACSARSRQLELWLRMVVDV